ncbi:MAG: hypothetical protein J5518_09280 [Lachnospiraceae bacterium]|nr:hypothetical protein [Lachnospiraceae bacterium]
MRIGKYPENAYKRSVQKYLTASRHTLITTVRQTALIHGTVPAVFLQDALNEIYASGSVPEAVSLGFALSPETEESTVSSVMKDLSALCEEADIPVSSADVHTYPDIRVSLLQITVTGRAGETGMVKPESGDLLLTAPIALAGTGILAKMREEELLQRFARPFVQRAQSFLNSLSVQKAAKTALENGAAFTYSLGEGGVFAGLWEMADLLQTGLNVDLKAIPVWQESVEICEQCRLNPYQLLATGALLVVAKNGFLMQQQLRAEGIDAELIGNIAPGNDRVITNDTETRYLTLPQVDEIYQIFC